MLKVIYTKLKLSNVIVLYTPIMRLTNNYSSMHDCNNSLKNTSKSPLVLVRYSKE